MEDNSDDLRIVLHAPTVAALARARRLAPNDR
jgi:hypothetical protein